MASFFLPSHMRPHVAAVYSFARAADDFADEGTRSAEDRHRLLDGWLRRLREAAASEGPGEDPGPGEPRHAVQIFVALGASIRSKALPIGLFEDLLSAFRQDVSVTRYETWADLHDYCRRSANPVGRLVLRIAGYRSERLDRWSDAICTALQLTNFWQDLAIDSARGRVYVPGAEMRLHGAREEDLTSARVTDEWRHTMRAAVSHTRQLLDAGRPLCDAVSGRLRYELRATWLGGTRILDAIAAGGFDVIGRRPAIGAGDAWWFARRMLRWSFIGTGPAPASRTS